MQDEPTSARLNAAAITRAQANDWGAALGLLDRAIGLDPDNAAIHCNRGGVLHHLKRYGDALVSYERALALQPDSPQALNNRGAVLADLGRFDQALSSYDRAIALAPAYAEAHYNRGNALRALERRDEALASYECALSLRGDYAKAHLNRGIVLHELQRYGEALASHDNTLALMPESSEAFNNRANTLRALGRPEEALAAYRRAFALNPDNRLVQSALIFALLRTSADPAELHAEYRLFAQRFETHVQPSPHPNSRDTERRLKIGYVSADFREHPVAAHIEPVLRNHDRRNFEIYCYSSYDGSDAVSERVMQHADHWRPVARMADDDLARAIQADAIDILVDLSGHTVGNRLGAFMRRPAPVQVTWLGLPASTGLSAMGYRLTDPYVDPPGMTEAFHSEKLIYLPAHACFHAEVSSCEVNGLPALSNGYVTFGSFNDPSKFSRATYAAWAGVLRAVPRSRFLIVCEAAVHDYVLRRFESLGVAPERLLLVDRLPLADYLRLHAQVDICLDTFPFNGGTVSRYALWMGVPVLTRAGRTPASRVGLALMSQTDLGDFVASDEPDYVARAVQWAADLSALAEVRRTLRGRVGDAPFSQPLPYTCALESAYRDMWRRWAESAET